MKKTTTRKGSAKTTGTSTLGTLEKNFRATPAKIIAQFRKEIAGSKQQQKKLQVALKKAQTQKQTSTKQITTLSAKKPSTTTKKQLATHKKNLGTHGKTIADLTKQLAHLKQTTSGLTLGQGKYSALNKHLSALDKEWKAKALTAKSATKAKKTTKPKARNKTLDTTKTATSSPYGSSNSNTPTYGNNTISDDETEKTD
jgi:chromosome segregation ATPase